MSRSRKHQGKPGRPRRPKGMTIIGGYTFPTWVVRQAQNGTLGKLTLSPYFVAFIKKHYLTKKNKLV